MFLLVTFLTIVMVVGFISGFVLPWINASRISSLQQEIAQLRQNVSQLTDETTEKITDASTQPATAQPAQQPLKTLEQVATPRQPLTERIDQDLADKKAETIASSTLPITPNEPVKTNSVATKKVKTGFEWQLGIRLPVWLGGIAIALAGLFLVQYSIEKNLLSPAVRLTLGGVFGFALLGCARWIRNHRDFSNGRRISQSLTGAGLIVLYGVSFASVQLYAVLPLSIGFLAMAAVTAMALALSIRHGSPIALLGLLGGFLTPLLLRSSHANIIILLVYLYLITSALLLVIRKTEWWWLSLPTVLAAMLGVIASWLFGNHDANDSIWLGLFLITVSASVVISSFQQLANTSSDRQSDAIQWTTILNYLTLAGATILMGIITAQSGFGVIQWALFGLLTLGGVILAYFDDKLYNFFPWVSMVVNITMLVIANVTNLPLFTSTLAIFATIHILSSYFLVFRSRTKQPVVWAILSVTASLLYYLLAYYKLHYLLSPWWIWSGSALLFGAIAVYSLFRVYHACPKGPLQQHLYTVFTVGANIFITLALFISLSYPFFTVTLTLQMAAIAWINLRVTIHCLRAMVTLLAALIALLLLPQMMLVLQTLLLPAIAIPPLFQLAIALMFVVSSYWLRQQQDNYLVNLFEAMFIVLAGMASYLFIGHYLHGNENILLVDLTAFDRSIMINLLLVYTLLCFWLGRYFQRVTFSWGAIVLATSAMLGITFFSIIVDNPLWGSETVKGMVIFNSLLLPYGLPIIWLYFIRRELINFSSDWLAKVTTWMMLGLMFLLISLNVRYMFHGATLQGVATNGEIYSYSAAWLLFGIGLLCAGFVKHSKMLRYASLGVLLLTVAKVFLYDASDLEGLYRVFSFLGLGVTLMGLSYFYTKLVFRDESKN